MTPAQKTLTWLKQHGVAIILLAIIALGAVLRMRDMTTSLQRDEIATYMVSSQDFAAAFGHNFYPMSYVLSHFALKIADSEALLRLPSFTAGLLGIWLMYFLGKTWHSRRTGLVAAFLLSVSSIHIYYSRDGRFYSLVTLAVILTLWAIFRVLENPRQLKWWLVYISGIILGILSHPFYLPFLWSIIAGAVIAAFFSRALKPNRWYFMALLLAFTAVGLAPACFLYYEFKQARPGSITNLTPILHRDFRLTPARYISFYKSCLLYQQPQASAIMFILMAGGAILLAKRKRLSALSVLAIPLLMPLPFFFFSVNHDYSIRYFAPHSAVISLLVAVCLVQIARHTGYWLCSPFHKRLPCLRLLQTGLLIGGIAILTPATLTKHLYDYHYTEIWKDEARVMAPYVTDQDIIIYVAPYDPGSGNKPTQHPSENFELNFYLQRLLIPGRRERLPQPPLYTDKTDQLQNWLIKYRDRNVWLVHRTSRPILQLSRPQQLLFNTLIIGQREIFNVIGAPTTNLVRHGDFEDITSEQLQKSGAVRIVQRDQNPKNGSCLNLKASGAGTSAAVRFTISKDSKTSQTGQEPVLNKDKNYILSCDLKYHQAEGGTVTTGSVVVALVGKAAGGQSISIPVKSFYWWSDWHFQDFPIRIDDYPQAFAATELAVEFRYTGFAGQMWVDNIQFEAGDHPTPYVNGTRLPHDQALAKLDAELARN